MYNPDASELNYDGLEWQPPFISTEPIGTEPVYYVHNMVDSETGENFSWLVRVQPNEYDQSTAHAMSPNVDMAWFKAMWLNRTIIFTDLAKEQ